MPPTYGGVPGMPPTYGGVPGYAPFYTFSQETPGLRKRPKDTRIANDFWRFRRFDRFDIPGYSRVSAPDVPPLTLLVRNVQD